MINPEYEVEWFHELIAEKLEDAFKCAQEGKKKRIILSIPPRHGKSQLSSIYFPAWALGKDPSLRFVISTYGQELADFNGLKTRDVVGSDAHKMIFPDMKLKQDMQGRSNWMVEDTKQKSKQPGYYYAVGVGGPITGRGADVLIIDDPHKDRFEAESETMRARVWDYYRSTLYSRLEGHGVVIVIMQRWRQDDLVGLLLEEDEKRKANGEQCEGWEVINFPAIAEEDEYNNGVLLRKEGEPLWPSKFSMDVLNSIRQTSPYYWASQYQQNPILAETAEFKQEMFRYYKDEDLEYKALRYFTLVDPAISQKKSADNSVVLTVAKEINGPNIYRIREDAGKYTPRQLVDLIFMHVNDFRSDVWVETVAYQEALKYMIREEQIKKERYFTLREIKSITNKETRIRGLLGLYQNGIIWHRKGADATYELELMAFPRGRHDDRIDCQAFLLRAFEDIGTTRNKAKITRPRYVGYGRRG